MLPDLEAGDGLLDRSELEIELARFALRLARGPGGADRIAQAADWIQYEAASLVARARPEHRPWASERVREVVESLAGVSLQLIAPAYGVEVNAPAQTPVRP